MTLHQRINPQQDRRQADVQPLVERRLSPMAARVQRNKLDGLRLGGERPTGADETLSTRSAA